MENRKPFQLRAVLIVYNFIQVIFSSWLFYEACVSGWMTGYSLRCQPVDYSSSPKALRVYVDLLNCRMFTNFLILNGLSPRWQTVAGGTIFRNSQSSLTLFSL